MSWATMYENAIPVVVNFTRMDHHYKNIMFAKEKYEYLMSIGDPRVQDWPLMSSPRITLIIAFLYLAICYFGPKWMSNKKPWSINSFVLLYNLLITTLNVYIGAELFLTSTQLTYNWECEPVDYSNDPKAIRIASALWWYYASKGFELFDSLFFILRKKESQLTFLHVYHHSTMFCLWWIGVKYVAGGSSFLGAMFNSFVHILMYSYYFLTACGPKVRAYLWWKKYLTSIQMVQFVFALVMGINAIRIGCAFPLWMQYAMVVYMVSFLVLFSDFYYKAYMRKKKLN
ncbi:very long chain fatty acid elongase 4 isoform X2 [Lepeophtheirus salmonis]|nr:elongation of very long chain fatty acids protein 4-like isoform X2 [Lepeophtheirus salmonis]XP_040576930.1 elongation of very long chain fatty acids protein 4-like isoform X2 [Lepeophtheirus salmonis]